MRGGKLTIRAGQWGAASSSRRSPTTRSGCPTNGEWPVRHSRTSVRRADDVGGGSVFPVVALRDASPATGGLRTQQADRPDGERFGTVVVEGVGGPVGVQAGRAVGPGVDRVLELPGRAAQTGRALAGVRHEGRRMDQVSRPAQPGDHRPAVGVTEHDRGLRQRVDDDLNSRAPQAFRHQGEVFGTVIQAMNEHHGGQCVRLLASVSGEWSGAGQPYRRSSPSTYASSRSANTSDVRSSRPSSRHGPASFTASGQ